MLIERLVLIVKFVLVVLLLFVSTANKGLSAQFNLVEQGGEVVGITVEGRIRHHDYEKFDAALQIAAKRGFLKWGDIYLMSPGGETYEALRIARTVKRLYLNTVAPTANDRGSICPIRPKFGRDCQCKSACVLIFSAGAIRTGNAIRVHRSWQVNQVGKLFVRDSQASEVNAEIAEIYLEEFGMSSEFVERFLSTDSTSLWFMKPEEVIFYFGSLSTAAQLVRHFECEATGLQEVGSDACVMVQLAARRHDEFMSMFNLFVPSP